MVNLRASLFERIIGKIAWLMGRKLDKPQSAWWDEKLPLRTVRVNDYEICYVTAGQGPPVVLVHGFGTSMSIWAHQIKVLSNHFKVFALDLLGHGYSEKPDIEYPPEVYLNILSGFMKVQGISSASFVGHSMGGLLSICLAVSAPERIQRLVLVNSNSPLSRPERLMRLYERSQQRPWLWENLWVLLELFIAVPLQFIEKRSQKKMVYDPNAIPTEWSKHQYENRRSKGFSRMVISTIPNMINIFEYENKMKDIKHPAYIICGDSDNVISLEHSRLLQRTLQNAKMDVIAECGHMSTFEKPEPTSRMILDFLKSDTR